MVGCLFVAIALLVSLFWVAVVSIGLVMFLLRNPIAIPVAVVVVGGVIVFAKDRWQRWRGEQSRRRTRKGRW